MAEPPKPRPRCARVLSWIDAHNARLSLVVAVVGIGVAIILAQGSRPEPTPPAPSGSSQGGQPAATDVRPFRPFTDVGLGSEFAVTSQMAGECSPGGSMVSTNPNALRCFADDGSVLDPCWSNIEETQVVCLDAPWERDVILLDPISFEDVPPPDPPSPGEQLLPFALEIETAAGERMGCIALSSFAGEVGTLRRNYDCVGINDATAQGSVFGDPDRTQTPWKVYFARPDSTSLTMVNVLVAWT